MICANARHYCWRLNHVVLPLLLRINVSERWTSSSPNPDRCCWLPTWHPEGWTFLMLTVSLTTTSPLTPRYRSDASCAAGWLSDFFSVDLTLVGLLSLPHRTTSIELAEQPEQAGRGNPSLLLLSKSCLFIFNIFLNSMISFLNCNYFLMWASKWKRVNCDKRTSSSSVHLRYDVELFQRIESLIGKKLPAFPTQEEEVMMLVERVSEAQRFARLVSHCWDINLTRLIN